MAHRRRAKAPKNTTKNTSKAPQEVDLTVDSAPMPSTVVEQSKGSRTFLLGMVVYANGKTLSSNILPVSFGVFKF